MPRLTTSAKAAAAYESHRSYLRGRKCKLLKREGEQEEGEQEQLSEVSHRLSNLDRKTFIKSVLAAEKAFHKDRANLLRRKSRLLAEGKFAEASILLKELNQQDKGKVIDQAIEAAKNMFNTGATNITTGATNQANGTNPHGTTNGGGFGIGIAGGSGKGTTTGTNGTNAGGFGFGNGATMTTNAATATGTTTNSAANSAAAPNDGTMNGGGFGATSNAAAAPNDGTMSTGVFGATSNAAAAPNDGTMSGGFGSPPPSVQLARIPFLSPPAGVSSPAGGLWPTPAQNTTLALAQNGTPNSHSHSLPIQVANGTAGDILEYMRMDQLSLAAQASVIWGQVTMGVVQHATSHANTTSVQTTNANWGITNSGNGHPNWGSSHATSHANPNNGANWGNMNANLGNANNGSVHANNGSVQAAGAASAVAAPVIGGDAAAANGEASSAEVEEQGTTTTTTTTTAATVGAATGNEAAATSNAATKKRGHVDDEVEVVDIQGRRASRSAVQPVKVKHENPLDGTIRCPHESCCKKNIGLIVSERGCNVVTCTNHNPYYYFCFHCKVQVQDGVNSTCSCPKRNNIQTRRTELHNRNKRNKENPILLASPGRVVEERNKTEGKDSGSQPK